MMSNLFLGRDAFLNFSVSVTGIILVVPSLFWLFFSNRGFNLGKGQTDDKGWNKTASILFWRILIPLGILVFPVTSAAVQRMIGGQPYIDTMITAPTAVVTIFSFMHIVERFRLTGKKYVGASVCLAILIVTSSSIYMTYGHPLGFEFVSNKMKINPEVQEIGKTVGSDSVLLPEEIYGQINEFDSGIQGKSLAGIAHDWDYTVHVASAAASSQSPYVVIKKTNNDPSVFEAVNYKEIADTDHYVIYQRLE